MKTLILLLAMMLVSTVVLASNVVCGETGSLRYHRSVNTPDYLDCAINPRVPTSDIKFWKRAGDIIMDMSATEKRVITDAEDARRATATALRDSTITKLKGLGFTDAEVSLVLSSL